MGLVLGDEGELFRSDIVHPARVDEFALVAEFETLAMFEVDLPNPSCEIAGVDVWPVLFGVCPTGLETVESGDVNGDKGCGPGGTLAVRVVLVCGVGGAVDSDSCCGV